MLKKEAEVYKKLHNFQPIDYSDEIGFYVDEYRKKRKLIVFTKEEQFIL